MTDNSYPKPLVDSHTIGFRSSAKFTFFSSLVERWAMVQGKEMEDSKGRGMIGLLSVDETIDRAEQLTDAVFAVAEKRGWIDEPLPFEEYADLVAIYERMKFGGTKDRNEVERLIKQFIDNGVLA